VPKIRVPVPVGQILTVTPVGNVQVYANGGAAGAFITSPTAYGPFTTAKDLTVDGTASVALSAYDPASFRGTFVCNGTSAVTIANANVLATDAIIISLNTVGGTVGATPHVDTITPGTGFTTKGTASDTSTYNYAILRNAA
jgi:hypothetical protein